MKEVYKYFEQSLSTAKDWATKTVAEKGFQDWADISTYAYKLKRMRPLLDEELQVIWDMRIIHLFLIAEKWRTRKKS
jgi:hypothetical protein